jgi:hypothetical protein
VWLGPAQSQEQNVFASGEIDLIAIATANGGVESLKRRKRELGPLPDTVTALL